MNYYEHHLGDYFKDAGHLSMIEHGAYRLLLDAYYIREAPLPAEIKECCKLARASYKPERDAVAYVLREFFKLRADGWHQDRADREIERYKDKQAKAKRSAEARWNAPKKQTERNANASGHAMRTHSEGNAIKERKGKERKLNEIKKIQYGDCVFLNDDEFLKLKNTYGEVAAKGMIEILDNYKASSGKNYKNDYRAILNWVVDRWNEKQKNRKTNGHDFAVTDTRFVPKEYDENEKF